MVGWLVGLWWVASSWCVQRGIFVCRMTAVAIPPLSIPHYSPAKLLTHAIKQFVIAAICILQSKDLRNR